MTKEEDNLWTSLLQEVQASRSPVGQLSSSGVLFLGDKDSGKTTLVAKLQGNGDPKKGSGLEYSYIEIRDDCYEAKAHLSVNVLDGDLNHSNLLRFAISPENLHSTTVVLCASMETPWNILAQLNKWASVLEEHLDSLDVDPAEMDRLKTNIQERWRNYSDFVDFFDFSPADNMMTKSSLGKSQIDFSTQESSEMLRNNLGLDIIVVITKTDVMTRMEAEQNINDEKFDFIQQAIRNFCLSYGASLFYLSVKEDKNCDLLYKYLVHRIYDFSFNTPALVVERDALFIPAGWDSPTKISILHENIRSFSIDTPYHEVIRAPQYQFLPAASAMLVGGSPLHRGGSNRLSGSGQPRVEIVAEHEQDFLARLYQFLGEDNPSVNGVGVSGTGGMVGTEEGVLKTPERRVYGSPGVGGHKLLRGGVSVGGPGVGVGGGYHHTHHHSLTSDGAISSFFHALLNKKNPGAGGTSVSPSSGGSPMHQAAQKSANLEELKQRQASIELENQVNNNTNTTTGDINNHVSNNSSDVVPGQTILEPGDGITPQIPGQALAQ